MSGGKDTVVVGSENTAGAGYHTGAALAGAAFGIAAGATAVLAAGGIAAYENVTVAVEMEKLVRQENRRHQQAQIAYRRNSRQVFESYQELLRDWEARQGYVGSVGTVRTNEETVRTETQLRAGVRPIAPREESRSAAVQREAQEARVREQHNRELYRQIVQTAESMVTADWAGKPKAEALVKEAGQILHRIDYGAEGRQRELERLVKQTAALAAESAAELCRAESLKQEYLALAARVNVLNRVLEKPLVLMRPFRAETAESDIRCLQEQGKALEQALDVMLRGGNCAGNPEEVRRRVANGMNRVMEQLGLSFLGRSERDGMESSYFSFRHSAIRCTVTDRGRAAFECIGVPGQTKEAVVEDMEHFSSFYYERLTPALDAAGLGVKLVSESAPCEEIVRFLGANEMGAPADGGRRTAPEEPRERMMGGV